MPKVMQSPEQEPSGIKLSGEQADQKTRRRPWRKPWRGRHARRVREEGRIFIQLSGK